MGARESAPLFEDFLQSYINETKQDEEGGREASEDEHTSKADEQNSKGNSRDESPTTLSEEYDARGYPKRKIKRVPYRKFEVLRDTPMGKCISRERLNHLISPVVQSPPVGYYNPRDVKRVKSIMFKPKNMQSKSKILLKYQQIKHKPDLERKS